MNALGRILPLAPMGSILAAQVVLISATCAQPDSTPSVSNEYITGGGF